MPASPGDRGRTQNSELRRRESTCTASQTTAPARSTRFSGSCHGGFDVIAYDSRAHGGSEGTSCTYGYYEKHDLSRVLDTVPAGPVVLVGSPLGGAIALQAAAIDRRVTGVVAAETFSDLASIARERAPSFLTESTIRRALRIAEQLGQFSVGAVAPDRDARDIRVPVLLLHGAADTDTPPSHSQRVYDAVPGMKRLILVPGARHNESLNENA